MNALTIILAIYVALDIIADTTIMVILKKRGYSLKELALQFHRIMGNCGTEFAEGYDDADKQ